MARSCTVAEAESFIRAAEPGLTLNYFSTDPGDISLSASLQRGASVTMRTVVSRLRQVANAGRIDFVQRRDGGRLRYIAIWRAKASPVSPTYQFESCS